MKKIFLSIFLLCTTLTFADEAVIKDLMIALEKSNELLVQADEKIQSLEKENSELELHIRKLLSELEENTKLLVNAKQRIEKDQKEIEGLRESIEELIESGVEVKTYSWGLGAYVSWPLGGGIHIDYNLPWITKLGIMTGFNFNVEQQFPSVYAGIKINLD